MSTRVKIWSALVVVALLAIVTCVYFYLAPANPFRIVAPDRVSSWTIPVNENASTTATLEANIALLQSYVGTTTYSTADIYVGIANDYATLGNGKSAYQYYIKAITASSSEAIAYDNLGALFARLHATSTALAAYAKTVALSPSTEFYQLSYLDYLALVEPQSQTTLMAFAAAGQSLGSTTPDYLIARANWLAAIGSTTAAIADWEAVRAQVGPAQQAAIDLQIARLEK